MNDLIQVTIFSGFGINKIPLLRFVCTKAESKQSIKRRLNDIKPEMLSGIEILELWTWKKQADRKHH